MHSPSDNIEIMIFNEADEVIQELFKSLLSRYPIGVEVFMNGSEFIFDCHETNLKRCGLYIGSPDWIKKERGTIHPINNDNKCFQYA